MSAKQKGIYIGTDSGATTSKIGAVWQDGSTVPTKVLHHPTPSPNDPQAVVQSWIEGINEYLDQNKLNWDQVEGVGLAVPGVFRSYGVLDRSPNLPKEFEGWDVHTQYASALAEKAGRPIPLAVGNDGN